VARTINEAIRLIANFECEEISLDHDVEVYISHAGRGVTGNSRETFRAVAYFIGEKYGFSDLEVPKITIHSGNPVGAKELSKILDSYGINSIIKPIYEGT